MRAAVLFGILVMTASVVRAESLPAFYNVVGIAQTDVLNVRAAPNLSAQILSTLPHDATGLEVVGRDADDGWAQINIGEQTGWISLQFLARQPGQPDDTLPRPISCVGTEPFWDLTLPETGQAEINRIDADPVLIDTLAPVTAANRTDRYAVFGQGSEQVFTFIFHRDQCSDQMSDRAFGMSVDIFMTENSGVSYVTGCCSLLP
ncbi:MAG: SH3 domain-containing protein [Pseudomonadota bacterium]